MGHLNVNERLARFIDDRVERRRGSEIASLIRCTHGDNPLSYQGISSDGERVGGCPGS